MNKVTRIGFIILACLLALLVALTVVTAISENLTSGGGLAFLQALVSCGIATLAIATAFVLLILFNKTYKRYLAYIAIGMAAVAFLYFVIFFCAITSQNIAAIASRMSGTATTPATSGDYFYLISYTSYFVILAIAAPAVLALFKIARTREGLLYY